jgi:thiamine biosynthesis lipoprotein
MRSSIIQSDPIGNRERAVKIAQQQGRRVCRLRPAMGTYVALEACADTDARAAAAIEAAFAAIVRVDARMNPAHPASDLAAIQGAGRGGSVRVDAWTWEVLALAQRLTQLSDGIFDPCLPDAPGSIDDLRLDAPGLVRSRRAMHIDLGGIAKGFAVDKAVEALLAGGCTDGLVNAGGDLRTFGAPRPVLVRAPDREAWWLALGNEALAVSDPGAASRPAGHVGYYCRGRVMDAPAGPVAVVARSAAIADAMTKIVLLAEPTFARIVLDRVGATDILSGSAAVPPPRPLHPQPSVAS